MADELLEEHDDDLFEAEDKDVSTPEMSNATAEQNDVRDKETTFAEIAAFLKKYNAPAAVRGRKDTLEDRYFIKPNDPLPHLNHELAAACLAVDDNMRDRSLYALILNHTLPYRLKNMQVLAGMDHPNILPLVSAGTVQFSSDDRCRMVVVHEQPQYHTMREALKERKTPYTERLLIDEVIAPLSDVLKVMREKGVSHGCINLDTVYFGERVQLGECISEPAGYAQHFHFESTERCQAVPLGKGETTIAADCYALGILVLYMMLGIRHFDRIEEEQYMEKRLTLGTYNVLVGGKEYKGLEDFLKGVLNDDPAERWTPDHIEQWVRGKKYNLLTPSVLREAQRPFQFMEEDYFNRRALAHSISTHWEESKTALRNTHLSRWVEVSLHKNEMAEAVRIVMEKTGGIYGTSEKANNELVTRTICLLDPDGPLRFNMISCFADGLGLVLANAFHTRDQKRIQAVIEILDYNFFNYISEMLDESKTKRYASVLWKMQNCSRYLRMQVMGFGIERILYELNPTLPCQSPLLIDENVLTIEEMLSALDRIGNRKSRNFEYLDRHIAAFIANRMDTLKEVKLSELKMIPALGQNPQLIVLHMLSQAQRKVGRPKLKGLSSWAALRVVPLIDNFHSRTIRRKIRNSLKTASKTGELDKIFEVLMDQHNVNEDIQGFQRAVHRFSKNAKEIAKLENRKRLRAKADQVGTIFAMIVAYSTLLITMIVSIKKFYFGS